MAEPNFTPTLSMAAVARRGLGLRRKFGRGGAHGGVARAHQPGERRPIARREVKSMQLRRLAVVRRRCMHGLGPPQGRIDRLTHHSSLSGSIA